MYEFRRGYGEIELRVLFEILCLSLARNIRSRLESRRTSRSVNDGRGKTTGNSPASCLANAGNRLREEAGDFELMSRR